LKDVPGVWKEQRKKISIGEKSTNMVRPLGGGYHKIRLIRTESGRSQGRILRNGKQRADECEVTRKNIRLSEIKK